MALEQTPQSTIGFVMFFGSSSLRLSIIVDISPERVYSSVRSDKIVSLFRYFIFFSEGKIPVSKPFF